MVSSAHLSSVSSSLVEISEWGSEELEQPVDHTFNNPGQTTSITCNGQFHASTWYSGSTTCGVGVWRGLSSGEFVYCSCRKLMDSVFMNLADSKH